MTDLIKILDDTMKPGVSHVDMIKRRCTGWFQWFLENDCATHPVHDRNQLEFFVCGKEGIAAIEKDIRAATSCIDLVLWGFDPGMELVREGSTWPRGTTYGDLLTAKAREGVKVRMLLWYDGDVPLLNVIATLTKNVPDIGKMSGIPWREKVSNLVATRPPETTLRHKVLTMRAEYCAAWWHAALHGAFPNLEVRLRKAKTLPILANITKYLPNSVNTYTESASLLYVGTHHQKPILIDYAPDNDLGRKRNTCGYVMGLNSVTDYWDGKYHLYNDFLREVSADGAWWDDIWHCKPYRDYAIRVEGQALYNLNENFVQGWDNASGYLLANSANGSGSLGERRKSIQAKDIPVPEGARCRAQILRTQPEQQDATILKAYVLAGSNAINYIYIENQYFQLRDWPQLLKKMRSQYCQGLIDNGAKPADIAPLHLFLVIPQSERAEMVPNTYDMLNEFGQGGSMKTYDKLVQGQREADARQPPIPPEKPSTKPSLPLAEPPSLHPLGRALPSDVEIAHTLMRLGLSAGSSGTDAADIVRRWEASRSAKPVEPGTVVKDSARSSPANPKGELNALGIKPLVAMLMTYDSAKEAMNLRIKKRDNDAQAARATQEAEDNAKAGVNRGQANDADPLANDKYHKEYGIIPAPYREIYIHSKLMFVDDVYTTLGSANLNVRSMAGDSELNICTEAYAFTRAARRRVWGNLAGKDLDGGEEATRGGTAKTFRAWQDRMEVNRKSRSTPNVSPENNSFIHPFEDPRGEPIVRLA